MVLDLVIPLASKMGRILDVLRRKRSQSSISLKSDVVCYGVSSTVNSNQSRDDEIDKENEKPKVRGVDNNESLILTPYEGGDVLCYFTPSLESLDANESKQEDSLDPTHEKCTKIDQQVEDSGGEISICVGGEKAHTESLAMSDSFDGNEIIDEFIEVSDDVALESISESENSSEAAAASVSEVTEVSDDGILRDDEGNPIDPNEAEENMLRDDEGNIIDPKSLVLRDSFVDISCESDVYYDDSGEQNDPKELMSCIAEQGPPLMTDDSTQSEGEADSDFRVIPLHEESFPSYGCNHVSHDDWFKDSLSPLQHRDGENCKNTETKGRRNAFSRRRKRRGHRSSCEEYVHIMFHNKLSTLDEECWSDSYGMVSSGDESETESLRSAYSKQRNIKFRVSGSFDEEFIRARWEYSLQVMNSSFVNNGVLVDARDEINDFLIPALVELETGEI
mmetsp:Transcript_11968/g.22204  ORF Transcript_11968/g.22204 Transcript_11968/m.22204 type:complete len:449 (+) Transcript_11968:83-1429(+)|eukprot:CAMPEP_0201887132 /NCGR_PEP_ID=MMETSP0902-20130614/24168_1 /ASSEMBLY_ACC=CAM_ASM_000551 /TAXON_ID=420261 /ORGANISM="Thalassiosira antarctica, Strain CCMP982" /LENGTH=448 /DNA_ID=CAMNT_0048416961 /DNA_START=10 /DNA_END=1359 /DNA_ORIENTATION=+